MSKRVFTCLLSVACSLRSEASDGNAGSGKRFKASGGMDSRNYAMYNGECHIYMDPLRGEREDVMLGCIGSWKETLKPSFRTLHHPTIRADNDAASFAPAGILGNLDVPARVRWDLILLDEYDRFFVSRLVHDSLQTPHRSLLITYSFSSGGAISRFVGKCLTHGASITELLFVIILTHLQHTTSLKADRCLEKLANKVHHSRPSSRRSKW